MGPERQSVIYVHKTDCETKHGEVLRAIDDLTNRLYKDNGRKSVQTILCDHDRVIRALIWIVGVGITAGLGSVATMLVVFFSKLLPLVVTNPAVQSIVK